MTSAERASISRTDDVVCMLNSDITFKDRRCSHHVLPIDIGSIG